ncbi:MAG: PIN domain-containing protein [Candidatus Nezhaarchaeales archaeon]
MSKRRFRVLLDTSFILPMLGFETDMEVREVISKLRHYEVHYSDVSIIEALWKISKIIKTEEEMSVVAYGIDLIKGTFSKVDLNGEAVKVALKLYRMGHKDLVDNLLYGLSAANDMHFLTLDAKLREYVEKNNLKNTIVHPPQL